MTTENRTFSFSGSEQKRGVRLCGYCADAILITRASVKSGHGSPEKSSLFTLPSGINTLNVRHVQVEFWSGIF